MNPLPIITRPATRCTPSWTLQAASLQQARRTLHGFAWTNFQPSTTTAPIHRYATGTAAMNRSVLARDSPSRRLISDATNAAKSSSGAAQEPRLGEESADMPTDGAQEAPSGAAEVDQEAPPPSPSSASSSREEQLESEIKSLKDQLLRSLADQDNTRRIAQRDVESARQFAIRSFAKALLDVSDNLSRALEAVPPEEVDQAKGSTLATLYEGIQMTERGLNKAFESNGLVKFGTVGDAFDPNQHEALFQYADPTKEPGTIGQVMKAGFMLNRRVLRPAEVGVVKNPE